MAQKYLTTVLELTPARVSEPREYVDRNGAARSSVNVLFSSADSLYPISAYCDSQLGQELAANIGTVCHVTLNVNARAKDADAYLSCRVVSFRPAPVAVPA